MLVRLGNDRVSGGGLGRDNGGDGWLAGCPDVIVFKATHEDGYNTQVDSYCLPPPVRTRITGRLSLDDTIEQKLGTGISEPAPKLNKIFH